jgi:hypothetical protein
MMTTDTAQAVTATKDFQVDQRFDGNLKMYLGSGASSFGWYIGLNGGSTLGFFNAASIVRAYIVDSGYSPAGGSGSTFVGPTILAASLSTTTPGMVVEGAIGGTVDIFDVTSAGMGAKYLYVDRFGNVNVPLGLEAIGGIVANSNSIISSANGDYPALDVQGYTGGSADLLELHNQPGGTNLFTIAHSGAITVNGPGGTDLSIINYADSTAKILAYTTSGSNVGLQLQTSSGATMGVINLIAGIAAPVIQMGVAGSYYNGVTGTGACTHFIGGICVSF